MSFKKELAVFKEKGIELPEDIKNNGYSDKTSPYAEHHNFIFNRTYEALKELQEKAGEVKSVNNVSPDEFGEVSLDLTEFEKIENVDKKLKLKVDKVEGKVLSSNDYTDDEKLKLSSIEDKANNYVHPKTHDYKMITGLGTAATKNIGVSSGEIVEVGLDGKIDVNLVPSIALMDVETVSSEEDMLALNVQKGDICIRLDLNKTYILQQDENTLENWVELLTPTQEVSSVAGKKGEVVLNKSDVGLNNVDNTSDINKPVSIATQDILDKKYEKPITGISKNDLSDDVKTSLNKADTALQKVTKNDVGLNNVDNTSDINKPISTKQKEELDKKVDKVDGYGLSKNDFTDEQKLKLKNLKEIDTSTLATKIEVQEVSKKVGDLATLQTKERGNLVVAVNELFTDVDNGKDLIAKAIVDKGQQANKENTFEELSDSIRGIESVGGIVKSVQQGILNSSGTGAGKIKEVNINNVSINNSIVLIDCYSNQETPDRIFKTIELKNENTIEIAASESYASFQDNWKVIEFEKLKSKQTGVVSLRTDEKEKVINISEVNVNKSLFLYSWKNNFGSKLNGDSPGILSITPRFIMSNSKTLVATRPQNRQYGTIEIQWQVIEFD